jgi:hypothetical protein
LTKRGDPVGIAQINRHRNDRCANAGDRTIVVVTIVAVLASLERRSADHSELPLQMVKP